MAKAFLIDTTVCTACRGCQVACKQWHDLPAEVTNNRGRLQNPPDLSYVTFKLVRMREEIITGKLRWLFFPDQCRHCIEPPCLDTAGDETAIFKDPQSGAVIYTANTGYLQASEIMESCPYNIPRVGPNRILTKCDMCNGRVQNGLKPACVTTCPTGAMNFDEREKILELAQGRLKQVRKRFPEAQLLDPDDVSVIYLVVFDPLRYHAFSIASAKTPPAMTRQMALRRMMRPLTGWIS